MRLKIRPLVESISLTLLITQPAFALPNGKPFQELNALIEENATAIDENGNLIEQNSTAILALSSELSALDGRVGVLEANVDGLTTRFGVLETIVTANTHDITLAFARITSVQAELSDLNAAVTTNTQTIADAETAIAAAETTINQLNADLSTLYDTVAVNEAAIIDVQANITAAEAHLSQLETDIVANAAEIQTTNDNLNDLTASLLSLQAIIASNSAKILQTEADISIANDRIVTLNIQYNELLALIGANADASDAAIDALKTELLDLIAVTETDINANEAELLALRQLLSQLAQDNSNLAQDLRDQMLALALLVDSDSTSITALQAQVGTLSSTLTTLNAQYNLLSSLYGQLSDHVNEHHDEISELRSAVTSLSSRVDLLDIEHGFQVDVFTFKDEYSVDDTQHVNDLRQFFRDSETNKRFIHIVFNTAANNKISEVCVQDLYGTLFTYVTATFSHTGNSRSISGATRVNNGSWIGATIKVLSYNYVNLNYVAIGRPGYNNDNDLLYLINNGRTAGYELNDTFHQRAYQTVNTQAPTTVTYTIAGNRLDACGY